MEAINQGSACVGLCSKKWAVICALKRSPNELAKHQKKLISIDDHIGIGIAGLTSDARILSKYMQAQALASRMQMGRAIPVQRLVGDISEKAQKNTLGYGSRPFGVGFLVAGYDDAGAHIFDFNPTGNMVEYHAMAIGSRSQSARTSLDRRVSDLPNAQLEQLIIWALQALRDTLPPDAQPGLNGSNCSIGFVGEGSNWTILDEEEGVSEYLNKLPIQTPRMEDSGSQSPTAMEQEQEAYGDGSSTAGGDNGDEMN